MVVVEHQSPSLEIENEMKWRIISRSSCTPEVSLQTLVGMLLLVLLCGCAVSSFVFDRSKPAWRRSAVRVLTHSKDYYGPSETNDRATDHDVAAIEIVESDFRGAGVPRPDLTPDEIPTLLMKALEFNDFPTVDTGLKSMWAFAGDTVQFIYQNNRTDFIVTAHETAQQFPTSFYGVAMNGTSWSMETELNLVGGGSDNCSDAWIATQVMRTISSDGRLRRWQWELRKHRRPPNLGCWYVESIGSSDRKGQFEPE
jgi:hypothetical protein